MTDLAPQGGLGQSWFVLELDTTVEVVSSLNVRNSSGVTINIRNPVKVSVSAVQVAALEVVVRSQTRLQVAVNKVVLKLQKKGE